MPSVAGVTGKQQATGGSIGEAVAKLKAATDLPIAVGFGIRTPDQAAEVARHADGVVVGSAIGLHARTVLLPGHALCEVFLGHKDDVDLGQVERKIRKWTEKNSVGPKTISWQGIWVDRTESGELWLSPTL